MKIIITPTNRYFFINIQNDMTSIFYKFFTYVTQIYHMKKTSILLITECNVKKWESHIVWLLLHIVCTIDYASNVALTFALKSELKLIYQNFNKFNLLLMLCAHLKTLENIFITLIKDYFNND